MSHLLCLLLLTAAPAEAKPPAAPPDTVVVCPEEFKPALQPWIEHRQAQGRVLAFISNLKSAEDIRGEIRAVAKQGKLRFIVLVGDAEPNMDHDAKIRRRCVPTHLAKATVDVRWGSEPEIATDNWYANLKDNDADLKDNGVPDVAIGRLTADTPDELRVIVKKILAYENSTDFGPWRGKANFIAGVGGFGQVTDSVLEGGSKKLIMMGVPPSYVTTLTNASWQSPYCPLPPAFRDAACERMSEGCLFWCYIGHGAPHGLDYVHVPGNGFPIMNCQDCKRLNCTHCGPIALFLACYTGAFDNPKDCLAEDLLRTEGGPVAIIAASREAMPYGMAVLGQELMDECFRRHRETVGELLLKAKQNSVSFTRQFGFRRLVTDGIASAVANSPFVRAASIEGNSAYLSPSPVSLEAERMEHLQLMNLIGDPLLRIRYPREVAIKAPAQANPGDKIEVRGTCAVDGPCEVELICRRDLLRFTPRERAAYKSEDPAQAADFKTSYARANDTRWAVQPAVVKDGRLQLTLEIPAAARGPCHVRVFVQGEKDFAIGTSDIEIAPGK